MRKLSQTLLLGLSATAVTLSASPVDALQVINFEAGSPACAADVNQTIQALITAIDDNQTQIAALEARIAELEDPSLLSIISGSTYTVYTMEAGIGSSSDSSSAGFFSNFVGSDASTFTFNPGGVLSVSYEFVEAVTTLKVEANPGGDEDNIPKIQPLSDDIGSDTDTGTWSLVDSTLTINYDGDVEVFLVSPDGNMILSSAGEVESGSPDMTNVDMVVGIRAIPTIAP